jgi:protein SCO1/2
MGPTQKRITIALWGLVVLALVGIVVGKIMLPHPAAPSAAELEQRDEPPRGTGVLYPAPPLALTDQTGQPFNTAQLRGHPWVADFIFTSCGSICPTMTAKMVEIQKTTPADVHLVSFTVDPATDTPAILKTYGESFHADFGRWHFLTGTNAQMADAAYKMKISVKPASPDNAIMHSEKFLLVDAEGNVVGVYDGTSNEDVKRLTADATKLAGAKGKDS